MTIHTCSLAAALACGLAVLGCGGSDDEGGQTSGPVGGGLAIDR